jgi:hypothetical protein
MLSLWRHSTASRLIHFRAIVFFFAFLHFVVLCFGNDFSCFRVNPDFPLVPIVFITYSYTLSSKLIILIHLCTLNMKYHDVIYFYVVHISTALASWCASISVCFNSHAYLLSIYFSILWLPSWLLRSIYQISDGRTTFCFVLSFYYMFCKWWDKYLILN